jgi:hypothetical protein
MIQAITQSKRIKVLFLFIVLICSCEVETQEINPILIGKWSGGGENWGLIIEDGQTAYYWTNFNSESSEYNEYLFDNVKITDNNIYLEFISPPVFDSLVYEVVVFQGTYTIVADNHFILSGKPITIDASEGIGNMLFETIYEDIAYTHYFKD